MEENSKRKSSIGQFQREKYHGIRPMRKFRQLEREKSTEEIPKRKRPNGKSSEWALVSMGEVQCEMSGINVPMGQFQTHGKVEWENSKGTNSKWETSNGALSGGNSNWKLPMEKSKGTTPWGNSIGRIPTGKISQETCLRENCNGKVPKGKPKISKGRIPKGEFQRENSKGRIPKGEFQR